MKIVINSHINGTIALDHLLESMKLYKEFNEYEIIIIIGGYYKNNNYEIKKVDNLTYIYCNHNSIDFTGLIALLELYSQSNEHYLYLHDSCKIGSRFYEKLNTIETNNVSSIKINKNFSMNMGIYSQEIINKFNDFLLSKKNTDELKCMDFKINSNEDHIFKNDPNNLLLENYNNWIYYGPVDYYKTGTMRIVEYYPNLDLYKIKANWGQGQWTLNN
jgi:hypothetical protein